jgi:hypothetical protein
MFSKSLGPLFKISCGVFGPTKFKFFYNITSFLTGKEESAFDNRDRTFFSSESASGLPDGLFSNQKSKFRENLEGLT